jgi:hypothetical protein
MPDQQVKREAKETIIEVVVIAVLAVGTDQLVPGDLGDNLSAAVLTIGAIYMAVGIFRQWRRGR